MKILGASKTLRAIIEEIKVQTEAGNGAAALDIGVSMICAPTVDNSSFPIDLTSAGNLRTRMNLREMLKVEFDSAAALVSTDPLMAETIVRLHRRVEAQLLAISQSSLQTAQIAIPDLSTTDITAQNAELDKALNEAAAATIAAAAGDLNVQPDQEALQRSLDQHAMDLTGGGGLDLTSMGVGDMGADAMQMGDGSAELGALPGLDLGDMGGMSMDFETGDDDGDWGLDFDNM